MSITSEDIKKVNRYSEAIRQITHCNLSPNEQAALVRLLIDYFEADGDLESHRTADYCAYQSAVDFLWMAFRITLGQKFELLDLLG